MIVASLLASPGGGVALPEEQIWTVVAGIVSLRQADDDATPGPSRHCILFRITRSAASPAICRIRRPAGLPHRCSDVASVDCRDIGGRPLGKRQMKEGLRYIVRGNFET
jgi:hypothetical protein